MIVFKAIAGLVIAFVARGSVISGFHALTRGMFGQWPAGTTPTASYMVATVTVQVMACAVAGILAALVVGRARIRHAVAYGAVFSGLVLMADRTTLFSHPHPYQWPLALAPLLAVPLGAWLIVRLKPLAAAPSGGS